MIVSDKDEVQKSHADTADMSCMGKNAAYLGIQHTRLDCLEDCAWLPHRDQKALSISTAACHCTCCSRLCCCAIDAATVSKSPALLQAATKSARSDIACMGKSRRMTLLFSQKCHKMASNGEDGTLFHNHRVPYLSSSCHKATFMVHSHGFEISQITKNAVRAALTSAMMTLKASAAPRVLQGVARMQGR